MFHCLNDHKMLPGNPLRLKHWWICADKWSGRMQFPVSLSHSTRPPPSLGQQWQGPQKPSPCILSAIRRRSQPPPTCLKSAVVVKKKKSCCFRHCCPVVWRKNKTSFWSSPFQFTYSMQTKLYISTKLDQVICDSLKTKVTTIKLRKYLNQLRRC